MRILFLLSLLSASLHAQIILRVEGVALTETIKHQIATEFTMRAKAVTFDADTVSATDTVWTFRLDKSSENLDHSTIHTRKGWYGMTQLKKVLFKETIYYKFCTYTWTSQEQHAGNIHESSSNVDYMFNEHFVRFTGDHAYLYRGEWTVPFGQGYANETVSTQSIKSEKADNLTYKDQLKTQSLIALVGHKLSTL